MLKVSDAPRKKRRGVVASCSILLRYLYLSKLIADRHPNKEKRDFLAGLIMTWREVIRVTRRDQLFIFMKHKEFGYHESYCVQRWVGVIREGSETHVFKYSKDKEEGGGGG